MRNESSHPSLLFYVPRGGEAVDVMLRKPKQVYKYPDATGIRIEQSSGASAR